MFYIFSEFIFNGEYSPDQVKKRILDSERNIVTIYQQYFTKN